MGDSVTSDTITLELSSSSGPDIPLQVQLTMDPRYKPGALYVGKLSIGDLSCTVKAYALCSAAGGRMLVAFDERLDQEIEAINRLVEGPLMQTYKVGWGEYGVAIFPESE